MSERQAPFQSDPTTRPTRLEPLENAQTHARSATLLALLAASIVTCQAQEEEPLAKRGERLYADTCALCHGKNGEGYAADDAPRLAGQELLSHASDEFLRTAILRGRPGTTMSAWSTDRGGPLEGRDADAIIALLRGWQREPSVALDAAPIRGDASRATETYNTECRSCHGTNGVDGRYPQIGNPTFLASASDAYLRAAIERGRMETPMNAYASRLEAGAISDLVALLRSWQRPLDGPETLPPPPGGLVDVTLNPGGPDPGWEPNAQLVSVDEVQSAMVSGASFVIADARAPSDYGGGHIAGAVSVPFYRVADFVPDLPRDRYIITYCACPHAESGRAASELRARGYPRVAVLDEGFKVWRSRGYPIRSGGAP